MEELVTPLPRNRGDLDAVSASEDTAAGSAGLGASFLPAVVEQCS